MIRVSLKQNSREEVNIFSTDILCNNAEESSRHLFTVSYGKPDLGPFLQSIRVQFVMPFTVKDL